MLTLFYLEVKDILPMITVEFNHTITRTAEQAPFFPGSNPTPQESESYNYAMSLVSNGFGGIVNMTHTEDEFTWKNTFICSVEEFQRFKDFTSSDTNFIESMRLGYSYNLANNFTQTATVVYKDENGNVIEESDAF